MPPPTPYQLHLALADVLRRWNVDEPESALECSRVLAEWPPSYIVYPADDVRDPLAAFLARQLDRPFPTTTARWRIEASEAHALMGICHRDGQSVR